MQNISYCLKNLKKTRQKRGPKQVIKIGKICQVQRDLGEKVKKGMSMCREQEAEKKRNRHRGQEPHNHWRV